MSEQLPNPNVIPSPELPVFNDNIPLQARLALGGTALNPDQQIGQIDANQFGRRENDQFTHSCLSAGSMDERTTFWKNREGTFDQQKTQWKDHLVTRFKNKKDFYTSTDEGKKQADALKKLGIDAANFSSDTAEAIYQKWCNGQDGASNCEEFVNTLVSKYNTLEELQKDLPVFQWFSNIFGAQSGEVIAQLAAAKMKTKDENKRKELASKTNESPQLNETAQKNLKFLWDHRPDDVAQLQQRAQQEVQKPAGQQREQKPAAAAAQTKEDDIKAMKETAGIATEPVEVSAPRLDQLQQQLAAIKDPVDRNNPKVTRYFIDRPPSKITLSPEQMDQLEANENYFIPEEYEPGKWHIDVNKKIAPYDELYSTPLHPGDKRYTHASSIYPNSPDSLLGLAAIAAPDPERQAKLYGLMAKTILEIHKNDPAKIVRWFVKQSESQKNPETGGTFTSRRLFLNEDLIPGTQEERQHHERVMVDHDDPDKTLQFWLERYPQLEKALNSGKLEPYHHRWLEFMSHSINMPKLVELIKEESKKPVPIPLTKKKT